MASLITPQPGWMVDPNNPNGVVPIPGYQASNATPPASQATPTPGSNAGSLVKDPATGAYTLAPGSDMSPVPGSQSLGSLGLPSGSGTTPQQNSMGTGTAPGGDPYQTFINNISGMLKDAVSKNATAQTNLGGAANTLTNESVAPGGPTSFNPAIGSDSQVQGQQTLQAGFQPAITSLNTQMTNENNTLSNIANIANQDLADFKPTALAPGSSLVSPNGTILLNGVTYSAQVDPTTGSLTLLPQNTLNTPGSSGGSGVSNSTPQTVSGQTGAGIVGGVNVSAYNGGGDPNYATEVAGTYKAIQASIPAATMTTETVDAYIDSVAPKSGVTAQMILNAAHTYNVDPYLLLAVAQHESDFGTQGAATSTNNPFNVGNTGSATKNYSSISAGVMAGAATLAQYASSSTPASTSSQTSPSSVMQSTVGGTFSSASAAQVQKLPSNMQPYAQAGIFGIAYIDADRVPSNLTAAVQNQAANAGIPYLSTADVAAVQSLTQVQQNMQLMKTAASSTLGNGVVGEAENLGATALNTLTLGNAFPNFSQFNSYATAAINTLKGLAGSGGGFRITQSEIDTAQENVPTSTDTLAHAEKKIQVLQGLVDTTVAKIFPDAPVPIQLSDGTDATVPAKNFSAAVQLGAIPL